MARLKEKHIKKTYSEDEKSKLALLYSMLNIEDLHALFMNFYNVYDKNQDLQFELDEFIQMIDIYAREDFLGRDLMIELFKKHHVHIPKGPLAFIKM